MSTEPVREEFADGDALSKRLWHELQSAALDRHHGWRTPVLATTGLDGLAQARTVVLREVRMARQQLLIYTDARSPKVAEIQAQPLASLLCWSPSLRWQLRLQLRFDVVLDGAETATAWNNVRDLPSAHDYLAAQAPGSAQTALRAADLCTPQLAVLLGCVQSMDWLELRREGHRRARLGERGLEWLVP